MNSAAARGLLAQIERSRTAVAASKENIARCREAIGASLRLIARPREALKPRSFPIRPIPLVTDEQLVDLADRFEAAMEQRAIDHEVRQTVWGDGVVTSRRNEADA